MENHSKLPPATQWPDNPYRPEWAETDFMYSADGTGNFPNHACKLSYQLSKPFIRKFRTALDVGCRVGEFTRYLQLDFEQVYAFDPTLSKKFMFNVDLNKVTHFHCALGDQRGETRMYDGAHHERSGIEPRMVQLYTVDAFGFEDVDYIKIDVEGFEKKVLQGAAQTIMRFSPVIVIEQNHVVLEGDERYSAKAYLENVGYRQAAVDSRGWDFVMVRD